MQCESASQEIVKITDPHSLCRQNCQRMSPTSFPRPDVTPGDEADCSSLISSQKTGSWEEALQELDEESSGDCIQCVFRG